MMASPLIAASLPDDTKLVEFNDFSSGMNTQRAKHKLGIKESPMIRNAYVDDQPLSLVGRRGMSLSVSTPTLSKINFGFEQVFDDGSRKLYVSDSSRVFVTSDLTNFTVVKNTMTPTAKLNAVAGRGFVLFTNGVDAPFISSGLAGIALDGTNGFPNVPRGKYAAYYQERFFLYNTTANSSALHFQSLTSTDGFVLSPFEVRAWPIINQLNVGQGDGSNGSALDVFKGQLQAHKGSKSIFTLYGTDETNYFLRKTNSDSGASNQESVAQADGTSYYFAKDGVNGFDSQNSIRISDDIFPDMELVVGNLESIQSNTWDTQSDYSVAYSSFYQTTATLAGNLGVDITTFGVNSVGAFPSGATNFIVVDASDLTNYAVLRPTQTLAPGKDWELFGVTFWARAYGGGNAPRIKAKNTRTGAVARTRGQTVAGVNGQEYKIVEGYGNNDTYVEIESGYPVWTTADLTNGNLQIQIEGTGNKFDVFSPTDTAYGEIVFIPVSTGNYISQLTTITTLTSWGTFDSAYVQDIGNIQFYVRGATAANRIENSTWVSVMSGNNVPIPITNNYFQWASSISVKSNAYSGPRGSTFSPISPLIDSVDIEHNEGGSADTIPRSVEWKKRFLMLCSTEPTGTISTIWVKSKITNSKPNAWTKFTFANDYFRSIFKFNDNLYLGSGSSGKIYRFDYGTNDNGSPIEFYYETPEVSMDKIWFKKNQLEYLIEADQVSNATLVIKTAVEDNDFSTNTVNVDLNGDGTLIKSIKSTYIPKIGRSFTYGLQNNELDKSMRIHTFGIFYQDTKTRD